MNYSSFIVKIIKHPVQEVFSETNSVTKLIVQIPQKTKKSNSPIPRIIHLFIWGRLGTDFLEYYKLNDYIIVEGYLSLSPTRNPKIVKLSVYKIYPFLLSTKN